MAVFSFPVRCCVEYSLRSSDCQHDWSSVQLWIFLRTHLPSCSHYKYHNIGRYQLGLGLILILFCIRVGVPN